MVTQIFNLLKAPGDLIMSCLPTLKAVSAVSNAARLPIDTKIFAHSIPLVGIFDLLYPTTSFEFFLSTVVLKLNSLPSNLW